MALHKLAEVLLSGMCLIARGRGGAAAAAAWAGALQAADHNKRQRMPRLLEGLKVSLRLHSLLSKAEVSRPTKLPHLARLCLLFHLAHVDLQTIYAAMQQTGISTMSSELQQLSMVSMVRRHQCQCKVHSQQLQVDLQILLEAHPPKPALWDCSPRPTLLHSLMPHSLPCLTQLQCSMGSAWAGHHAMQKHLSQCTAERCQEDHQSW